MTAQDDDVLLRRLPIDRYVNWIAGRRYLTLLAVLGILQDVYDTHGDWAYAMRRNVPVRNVRPIEDRNAGIRAKRKFSRQENAQLLETVAEKMKSKSIRAEQEVEDER